MPTNQDLVVVHQGATVQQLSVMFDLSVNEVRRRLVGIVNPVSSPNKVPVFAVKEAAPYLCTVIFDPEEMIKALTPAKLPPALQDAFWKAQNNRQKFEENKGDLWKTERVIGVFGEVFKTIRMTILMFNDTLEQRTEVSGEQRKIIQSLGDGLLDSLHQSLVKEFEDYVAPDDEHGRPLKEEEMGSAKQVIVPESLQEGFDDGFGDED